MNRSGNTSRRRAGVRGTGRSLPETVRTAGSAVAFWTAVLLPAAHLDPFAVGVDAPLTSALSPALPAVHALALLGGRNHRRGGGRDRAGRPGDRPPARRDPRRPPPTAGPPCRRAAGPPARRLAGQYSLAVPA